MGVFLISIHRPGEISTASEMREKEMRSLLETLSLDVVCSASYMVKEVNVSTFLGSGQAAEAHDYVSAFEPEEAVIDALLSPRQEKNLERILGIPVSDREAVILSIFFQNAHSREARLQIERAEAEYLKPRLQNREASLSQQRGGVRGAKGEGERQIELERRLIDQRIRSLDRELASIEAVRNTKRKERQRNGIFSFALVGYTNAGKSTILNALTDAGVTAEDKLFATLDTTTRSLRLPNGQRVLLSDTVGFISDLPEVLIKAFSSTLEEALAADALIIVADASHPDAARCLEKTKETLSDLDALDKARILVINKMDSLSDDISYAVMKRSPMRIVEASMKEGRGIKELLSAMAAVTDEAFTDISVTEDASSDIISRLSRDGDVKSIVYGEGTVTVTARIRRRMATKYSHDQADSNNSDPF